MGVGSWGRDSWGHPVWRRTRPFLHTRVEMSELFHSSGECYGWLVMSGPLFSLGSYVTGTGDTGPPPSHSHAFGVTSGMETHRGTPRKVIKKCEVVMFHFFFSFRDGNLKIRGAQNPTQTQTLGRAQTQVDGQVQTQERDRVRDRDRARVHAHVTIDHSESSAAQRV